MKWLICVYVMSVINISNTQTFIKSEYVTTDFLKVSISFDRNNNNVVIIDNLGGIVVRSHAFYTQKEDMIFLYSKEEETLLFEYRILNEDILFDVVNGIYAITLKTYNKKYKDRMLIMNKDGSKKVIKINRWTKLGDDFIVLSKEEALKRFGIDGINGAIIFQK